MKIAYFDCLSGISGDMVLGALVDVGVPLGELQAAVDSLGVPDVRLECTDTKRRGFRAAKVRITHPEQRAHRHLHHITDMIGRSRLTPRQQERAVQIFTRLGEAEAKVHGSTLQKVHFHEVGAIDSIADIVGAAVGLDLLGVDRIECSPIPTGSGTIEIAHGRCQVPAPATAELLRGIPLAHSPVVAELTTPTGAALVATVVDHFGPLPPMVIDAIGYGAGDRDFAEQANLLRILVGTSVAKNPAATDEIVMLETNLDQATGEQIGYCCERLMALGALDVYTTSIQMKKQRPGILLTILCRPSEQEALEQCLFRETNTLGVRRSTVARRVLPRDTKSVETPWGSVPGKWITLAPQESRFAPEYEDCRRIALERGVPFATVVEAARRAAERA